MWQALSRRARVGGAIFDSYKRSCGMFSRSDAKSEFFALQQAKQRAYHVNSKRVTRVELFSCSLSVCLERFEMIVIIVKKFDISICPASHKIM